MTDPIQTQQASDNLEFEKGRYLFCLVRADDKETFSMDGIDGQPVSLVVEDGIGAVIQPVESVYDSDDMAQVRRWLLTHQSVVDAAGDTFGTPLPFRFDTIFKGDEKTVTEWVQDTSDELRDALEWLAGRWEYRIEIRWDETIVSETVREEETELQELATRMADASTGTRYLLDSQYEQLLADRLEKRRQQLEEEVLTDLEEYTVEIQRSSNSETVSLEEEDTDFETAVQLSILADSDHEDAIGDILEPLAAQPQYEVQYTGPWPPYSHAPVIGGDNET